MKKALALLLALTVVGFVFAEDAMAPYSVTGDATLAWAYNLTDNTNGFTNSYNFELIYNLLDEASATKGGEEGIYGQIDITHLNLRVDTTAKGTEPPVWSHESADGDNVSIAAKIVSGPFSVGIYGAPSASYEKAVFVPLFAADAGYDTDSALNPALTTTGGTWVKYDFGAMGNVKVSIASKAAVVAVPAVPAGADTVEYRLAQMAYTEAEAITAELVNLGTGLAWALGDGAVAIGDIIGITIPGTPGVPAVAGVDGYYLGGIDLTFNPIADVLAITAGAWYDPTLETLVATAKVAVTAGALSAYAAADIQNTTELVFDASGNVAFSMNEKKDTVSFDVYFTDVDHQGDFGLKFVDAEGFVPGLAFTVGAFGQDMLQTHDPLLLSVAQSLSYKIGDTMIKPYEAVRYDLTGALLYLNLGVEYSGIANTLVKADFAMGTKSYDYNAKLVGADEPMKITLSAKVTL